MTEDLKEQFIKRLKNEFEIYILMMVFAVWYLINISGAIKDDETIFALQGYYFIRGNMPAEQFRPMSRYFFGVGQLMFGRTTFGAKFFVFLFGIFTLYLTYKGTRYFGDRIYGFIAALMVGIIPLYGDLSVSALMDIILAFFVMLLFIFTLKILRCDDIIKKQRLLFFVGVLSICTLATKLYGVFFSLVVFIFLLYFEWETLRTIKLFKRRNMAKRLKKNLILIPVFIILGVLSGLLIRAQLSDYWEGAGEKGKADILDVLPGFLDEIILNMDGAMALGFFIVVGIVLLMIFWVIFALVGRESLRTLQHLAKKMALDKKYHILIYLLGAVIGFIIIYSPYLGNPVTLFSQILLNQTIHLKQSSPREVGGVLYDSAPWWSYLYWIWQYLGLMFICGLIVSLLYTAFRFIKKENLDFRHKFLLLYTFVPFVLLSALSLKHQNYFVILFPLFSIFIVTNITSLVRRILKGDVIKIKNHMEKLIPMCAIIILMMLPGPVWMNFGDPSLGWDSGYDDVAGRIKDYKDEHPGEEIAIIAFDWLSVEFYLSDDIQKDVEILPLFSDNFSKDILGRPYIYHSDEDLYSMLQNDSIAMLIDEPNRAPNRESLVRDYASNNSTSITWINDEVVMYYFEG